MTAGRGLDRLGILNAGYDHMGINTYACKLVDRNISVSIKNGHNSCSGQTKQGALQMELPGLHRLESLKLSIV